MATINPELTKKMQRWLDTEPAKRDLIEGANMLLALNRNRALFSTILRRPEKYADRLDYELKKFLRIRLDGMTRDKIIEMEKSVMPSAQQIIDTSVIDTSDELPKASKQKGKRSDHDSLPDKIKALWEDNFSLYKRIRLLFEELKALNNAQPCDRYDKLQLLASADRKYRNNLAEYDAYVPGKKTEPRALTEEEKKKVGAARKTVSKYRSRLAAGIESEKAKKEAVNAIQRNVDAVIALDRNFDAETKNELARYGITFGDK